MQNIPIRSELGKQIRQGFRADSHQLAELDDDGNPARYFRHYRYICRCGKAGAWQPSTITAQGEHAVHRAGSSSTEQPL